MSSFSQEGSRRRIGWLTVAASIGGSAAVTLWLCAYAGLAPFGAKRAIAAAEVRTEKLVLHRHAQPNEELTLSFDGRGPGLAMRLEPGGRAVAPAPAGAGEGSITGTVDFTGVARPSIEHLRQADAYCAHSRSFDESVVVNPDKTLKNVVVHLVGAPSMSAPRAAATVEQTGCTYQPHVQAVIAGQRVDIVNGDRTLHSVHTWRGPATWFNQAHLAFSPPIVKTLPEGIFKLTCDVHPWMVGSVVAFPDRYFSVTDEDGRFLIANVPPGRYTVDAWHERYGTKSLPVLVTDGAVTELTFRYDGTERQR